MGVDTISTGTRFYGITMFRLSVGETILRNLPSQKREVAADPGSVPRIDPVPASTGLTDKSHALTTTQRNIRT
jgi:hypothetical protein